MNDSAADRKAAGRLTRYDFHILLALADAQRHGYGIMQEVARRSDGQVRMGPGTLYGALKRLLGEGMIEKSGERPASGSDDPRRRNYYRLTPRGREVAVAEVEQLQQLLRVARTKRLISGTVPAAEGGVK